MSVSSSCSPSPGDPMPRSPDGGLTRQREPHEPSEYRVRGHGGSTVHDESREVGGAARRRDGDRAGTGIHDRHPARERVAAPCSTLRVRRDDESASGRTTPSPAGRRRSSASRGPCRDRCGRRSSPVRSPRARRPRTPPARSRSSPDRSAARRAPTTCLSSGRRVRSRCRGGRRRRRACRRSRRPSTPSPLNVVATRPVRASTRAYPSPSNPTHTAPAPNQIEAGVDASAMRRTRRPVSGSRRHSSARSRSIAQTAPAPAARAQGRKPPSAARRVVTPVAGSMRATCLASRQATQSAPPAETSACCWYGIVRAPQSGVTCPRGDGDGATRTSSAVRKAEGASTSDTLGGADAARPRPISTLDRPRAALDRADPYADARRHTRSSGRVARTRLGRVRAAIRCSSGTRSAPASSGETIGEIAPVLAAAGSACSPRRAGVRRIAAAARRSGSRWLDARAVGPRGGGRQGHRPLRVRRPFVGRVDRARRGRGGSLARARARARRQRAHRLRLAPRRATAAGRGVGEPGILARPRPAMPRGDRGGDVGPLGAARQRVLAGRRRAGDPDAPPARDAAAARRAEP